eukprot:scaffold95804_cov30-Phaeocystis_antarctica.AAC.1
MTERRLERAYSHIWEGARRPIESSSANECSPTRSAAAASAAARGACRGWWVGSAHPWGLHGGRQGACGKKSELPLYGSPKSRRAAPYSSAVAPKWAHVRLASHLNPRRSLTCRTRFKTAIAAARPFLGLCPSPLLWLKALDALYNFLAAGKVVGGKPGAR